MRFSLHHALPPLLTFAIIPTLQQNTTAILDMAGTRLIIQATLLLELVILVLIAAFFGLCHRNNDVLCTPILSQGCRSSIVLPSKWQEKRVIERTEDESNSLRRYNMHVTLVLEDGSEWSEWAPAMDDVLSLKNLVNLPCLKGPIKTEILLQGSLSEKTRTVVNNANNTSEYRISGSVVKRWLTARRNTFDESHLDLLLYVPVLSKSPLMVKLKDMQPTTALVWEQQLLSIVERNGDDASSSNKRLAMENAMAYVDPFLKDECQLSSNTTEWWQQLVHDTQERAKDSVLINHKILSKSSLKVPITNEVRLSLTLCVAALVWLYHKNS